jgi:hypothetical protein
MHSSSYSRRLAATLVLVLAVVLPPGIRLRSMGSGSGRGSLGSRGQTEGEASEGLGSSYSCPLAMAASDSEVNSRQQTLKNAEFIRGVS